MLKEINKSPLQVKDFWEHGVSFPYQVLSEDEVIGTRKEFELMEQAFGGCLTYAGNLHAHLGWAHDLVLHSKILDHITPILGDDICIQGSLMLTKYPKTKAHISWHQDGVTSGWDENHSLSVWLALTESNSENGCVRVIPGSHLASKRNHVFTSDENNMALKSFEIDLDVDENKSLLLELEPGEISIHHNSIIHCSKMNTSNTKRMGYIIRYADSNFIESGKETMYVSGAKKEHHRVGNQRPDDFQSKHDSSLYADFLKKKIVLK